MHALRRRVLRSLPAPCAACSACVRVVLAGLQTVPISASSAAQRCGRAGRVAAGTCVRLWPESETLVAHTPPAIAKADLASLALQLAACGHADSESVFALRWLTPPPTHALQEAQALLCSLGALRNTSTRLARDADADLDLDDAPSDGTDFVTLASRLRLTRHGRALASLPLHPRLGHMLVTSRNLKISGEAPPSFDVAAVACALAAIVEEGGDLLQVVRAEIASNLHILMT
eukprot:6195728-Pleurochrysis_carterae.AAC.2